MPFIIQFFVVNIQLCMYKRLRLLYCVVNKKMYCVGTRTIKLTSNDGNERKQNTRVLYAFRKTKIIKINNNNNIIDTVDIDLNTYPLP